MQMQGTKQLMDVTPYPHSYPQTKSTRFHKYIFDKTVESQKKIRYICRSKGGRNLSMCRNGEFIIRGSS